MQKEIRKRWCNRGNSCWDERGDRRGERRESQGKREDRQRYEQFIGYVVEELRK